MANYYVDPVNGNDSWDGTRGSYQGGTTGPWKTASKANSSHAASDNVYFISGGTWLFDNEGLNKFQPKSSVTIGSYYMSGGSEVVGVSGNKPKFDGQTVRPTGFYDGLIRPVDDGSVSGVTVQDFSVVNTYGNGILFRSCNNSSAIRCYTANNGDAGIRGVTSNNLIFRDSISENAAFGNTTAPGSFCLFTCNDCLMENNVGRSSRGEFFLAGKGCLRTTIRNNVTFDVEEADIYIGASSYSTVYNHLSVRGVNSVDKKIGLGLTIEINRPAGSVASNNIFYNILLSGMQSGIWVANQRPADSVMQNNEFYHITLVDCTKSLNITGDISATSGMVFKNNIFQNYTAGLSNYSGPSSLPGFTFSNNHWSDNVSGLPVASASDTTGDAKLARTTGWRTAISENDIVADDFKILSGSPCIGAGTFLSSYATDYAGNLRSAGNTDIGAFQYVNTTAVPDAPTNVSVSPGNTQNTIAWSNSPGATTHNIYWGTSTGVTKLNGTKIAGASSPYTHTGLTNGTTIYYVVTAENSNGESVESAEVSATPTAGTSLSGLVVDTFTGTDSTSIAARNPDTDTVGNGWVIDSGGSITIQGNAARPGATNTGARIDSGVTNQVVAVDINANGSDNRFAINLRQNNSDLSASTRYEFFVRVNNGSVAINKFVGGTKTNLASGTASTGISSTHNIEASVSGDTLSMKIDGAVVLTATDTEITTGSYAGFSSAGVWSNGSFDNFTINKALYGIVADNFTDTDGTDASAHTPNIAPTGSAWFDSGANTIEIDTNRLRPRSANKAAWIDTKVVDHKLTVVASDAGTSSNIVIEVRRDNSSFGSETCYNLFIGFTTGKLELYKAIAGTYTLLSSTNYTYVSNTEYTFELSIIGQDLTVSVDSTPIAALSITDTSISSGTYIGIRSAGVWATPGPYFDDLRVSDETPSTYVSSDKGLERGLERGLFK